MVTIDKEEKSLLKKLYKKFLGLQKDFEVSTSDVDSFFKKQYLADKKVVSWNDLQLLVGKLPSLDMPESHALKLMFKAFDQALAKCYLVNQEYYERLSKTVHDESGEGGSNE